MGTRRLERSATALGAVREVQRQGRESAASELVRRAGRVGTIPGVSVAPSMAPYSWARDAGGRPFATNPSRPLGCSPLGLLRQPVILFRDSLHAVSSGSQAYSPGHLPCVSSTLAPVLGIAPPPQQLGCIARFVHKGSTQRSVRRGAHRNPGTPLRNMKTRFR
jgi:hypothetical protein